MFKQGLARPHQVWPQHRLILGLLLPWLIQVGPVLGRSKVFRCDTPNAPPLFSNTPCDGAREVEPVVGNGFKLPELSRTEAAQLRSLEQRSAKAGIRRQQQSKQHYRQQRRNQCKEARLALDQIAHQRRRGYRLNQAQALEQRERQLRAKLTNNC